MSELATEAATPQADLMFLAPNFTHYSNLLFSQLPCALVASDGAILSVSPGLSALVADCVGQNFYEAFQLPGSTDNADKLYGIYRNSAGAFTPAIIYLSPLEEGVTLAIVSDGQPFRDADAARFQSSAYGTLRVDRLGTIAFSNLVAAQIFGGASAEQLIGRRLIELFASEEKKQVVQALRACMRNKTAQTLSPTTAAKKEGAPGPLRLMIMPDAAPGSQILGAVVVIQSLTIEHARDSIKKIALERGSWRSRLHKILAVVHDLLPFDQATFGIYADNTALFHPVYIEPVGRPWPAYWMRLQDGIRAWLESGKTWEDDLAKFIKKFPELENDPVVRLHWDYGIRSFVTLPVSGPDGPTSSLSFASVKSHAYGRKALQLVQSLELVQILMMFEREIMDERRAFRRGMEARIRSAGSLKASARVLVEGLRKHFKWDHVSILTIDAPFDKEHGTFRLLTQACNEGCGLPPDFTLPRSEGMLGATLDANKGSDTKDAEILTIEDTRVVPRKHNYIPINDRLLSAMTYPMRLNGEWRWIIDIQAPVTNAFHGPDIEAVKEIILELEDEFERLYHSELNHVLLEKMPEGVIVVGPRGAIQQMNRAAERRFVDTTLGNRPRLLRELAADSTTEEIIDGRLPDTSRRLLLRGGDGRTQTVLATRTDLAEDYQSSVWFLTDLDNLNWNVEYRYLRAVVSDVAQQTRGPLMLASGLMQKAFNVLGPDATPQAVREAVARAMAEIGKADITFERLAESLSILKLPKRQAIEFDLSRSIDEIIGALPERDRRHVLLDDVEADVRLVGDEGRLRFVIRSLSGYLLRCRSGDDQSDSKINIVLNRREGVFHLSLLIANDALSPGQEGLAPNLENDALAIAVAVARGDAGVGLEVVESIIAAHGGSLTKRAMPSDQTSPITAWSGFWIDIPAQSGGAA